MNKFLPVQFQPNCRAFLKIGVISLALSLSVGACNCAYAQSVPNIEVLSVSPQEAFFVEDKASVTSPQQDSEFEDENEDKPRDRTTIAYLSNGSESQHRSDI